MSVDSFFVNEPFTVSQNALLFVANQNNVVFSDYDFILNVDLDNVNDIFLTRSFVQTSAIPNNIGENTTNINMSINTNYLTNYLFAGVFGNNNVHIDTGKSTLLNTGSFDHFGNMNSGNLLGLQLLEIAAHRIFGHAAARSAIQNDTDFYLSTAGYLYDQISQGFNTIVVNQQNLLFNQYVQTGRYGREVNNDLSTPQLMNFQGTLFEFPIFYEGNILDESGSSSSNIELIWNGPNVGADTTPMING